MSSFSEIQSILSWMHDLPTPSEQNAEPKMQNSLDDCTAAGSSASPTVAATLAADPIMASITQQLDSLDIAPPATTPARPPAPAPSPSPPSSPPPPPQTPASEEQPEMTDSDDDDDDDEDEDEDDYNNHPDAGIMRRAHPGSGAYTLRQPLPRPARSAFELQQIRSLADAAFRIQQERFRGRSEQWCRQQMRRAIEARQRVGSGGGGGSVAKRVGITAAARRGRVGGLRRAAGMLDGRSRGRSQVRSVWSEGDGAGLVEMTEGGVVPARVWGFDGVDGGEVRADVEMGGA